MKRIAAIAGSLALAATMGLVGMIPANAEDAGTLKLVVPTQGCTAKSWVQTTGGAYTYGQDTFTLTTPAVAGDNRFTVQTNSPDVEVTECIVTGPGVLTLDGEVVEPYQKDLAAGGKNLQVTWRSPVVAKPTIAQPVEATFTQPFCEAGEDGKFTVQDGSVTIPETEGVTYLFNGGDAVSGVTYPLNPGGENTLTAVPNEGYVFAEGTEFSQIITMDSPVCMTPLEPSTPIEPTDPVDPTDPPADEPTDEPSDTPTDVPAKPAKDRPAFAPVVDKTVPPATQHEPYTLARTGAPSVVYGLMAQALAAGGGVMVLARRRRTA